MPLPGEVLSMICIWLEFNDLRNLAGASQRLWRAACPILWANVYRFEYLLRAIFKDKLRTIPRWYENAGTDQEVQVSLCSK